MKRSTKVKWGEIKVGILIAIAIFVLLWASFSGSGTSELFRGADRGDAFSAGARATAVRYDASFPRVRYLLRPSR